MTPHRADYLKTYREKLKSPRREDHEARVASFRAWVMRQGADLITVADAKTRLRTTTGHAAAFLKRLVDEGILEKAGKSEWRLKGRTL